MSEQVLFETKPPHVYTAIAEVTGKLAKTGISKDRKNDQQGYKFRGIDDVYNALSGLISEAKLCLLPRVTSRDVTERVTPKGSVLFYVVCGMDFELVSAVDGSRHTVHVIGEAMDTGDKATNKAMSAAYKYMAMQVFCIPTEGDNDADASTHTVKAEEKPLPFTVEKAPDAKETDYALAMRKAVLERKADKVWQVHLDMRDEGEEFYRAAWDKLDAPTRAKAKEIIDLRKAAA